MKTQKNIIHKSFSTTFLMIILISISTSSYSANVQIKSNTLKDKEYQWTTGKSWEGNQAPVTTGIKNTDIFIQNYMVQNGDLDFDNQGELTIESEARLVIDGNLSFRNQSKLTINGTGILVVIGDLTIDQQIEIANNGKLVVTGSASIGNKNSKITNNGSIYTFEGNNFTAIKTYEGTNPGDEMEFLASGNQTLINLVGMYYTLPVQLAYFKGTTSQYKVSLSWATLSEKGFNYFDVERSTNGKHFESIGIISGAGNSLHKQEYVFIDKQPLPGVNYYRLKAVDFDGYTEYFAPIAVFNNNVQLKVATLVGDHQLRIFSNLSAEARIYNLQGLPVHSGTITSGVNDINLPATVSGGYYVVGIYAGNELVKKEKVLVQ